jgi:hypothetical protein
VALQAKILIFAVRHRLQQLVLIVRSVRIVTGETIAHRRRMNPSFYLGRVFVGVTLQAQLDGCSCDQLDVRDVTVGANLMATQTPSRNRRVHRFSLGLVFVALQALCGICLGVERDRMDGGRCPRTRQQDKKRGDRQLNRQLADFRSRCARRRHACHSSPLGFMHVTNRETGDLGMVGYSAQLVESAMVDKLHSDYGKINRCRKWAFSHSGIREITHVTGMFIFRW